MFWKIIAIIALLQGFAIVFGVLRIYNAIVANTRYLILLKAALGAHQSALKKLEAAMGTFSVNTKKAVSDISSAMEDYKITAKLLKEAMVSAFKEKK